VEVGVGKIRLAEVGIVDTSAVEIGAREVGLTKTAVGQHGKRQTGVRQILPVEVDALQAVARQFDLY
jgi:hypothetical protein